MHTCSADIRFNIEERQHKTKAKENHYHLCSRNRLRCVFSTNNNDVITTTCAHETIHRFNECVLKILLIYEYGTQAIGHAVDNTNNILHTQVIDIEDNADVVQITAPKWNGDLKCYTHDDDFNSFGHELLCFELIVLRFNANDWLNTFWFFSNMCSKNAKVGMKI